MKVSPELPRGQGTALTAWGLGVTPERRNESTMTKRRESMVQLAIALGVGVQAGESTSELMGRCLERAALLRAGFEESGARAEVQAQVPTERKATPKSGSARKPSRGRKVPRGVEARA